MDWKAIAELRKQGRRDELLARLQDALRRDEIDPEELERAGRLLAKELGEPATAVRVLGQCTTSWLSPMIAAIAWGSGLRLAVGDGGYDNVIQELTAHAPDVVVLLPWNDRLLGSDRPAEVRIADELAAWQHAWSLAADRRARVVQIGYDWLGAGPLGHHLSSEIAIVRELNHRLRDALPAGAYFVDLDAVSGQLGRARFYDPRQYHWTRQPFSMAGAAALARHVVAGIRALIAGPKK
ncbi:MAG TPA: hypothetical protein VLM79_33670, partial [Kofleriaceae bacterium]|nr:hypothetical protein [Kofleriaceae bacterium]